MTKDHPLDDARARLSSTSDEWETAVDAVEKSRVDFADALGAFGDASGALAGAHRSYEALLGDQLASGEGRCKNCNKKLFESCSGGRVLIVCSRCKESNVFEGVGGKA